MGRLSSSRARWLLSVCVVLALPLTSLLAANLRLADGLPLVSFTFGLLVAYLLSVGPRGAPVAVLAFVLDLMVVHDHALGPAVLVVAVVQAGVAVGTGLALEQRFAHHGPVRRPIVMVDYGLIAGAVAPLLLTAARGWFGGLLGLGSAGWAPVVCEALASGIGLLTVTAGIRMLIKGQYRLLAPHRWPVAVAAAVSSILAVLVAVRLAGDQVVATGQLLAVPVLALALMLGTVAYSLGAMLTVLGVTIPLAVVGIGDWQVSMATLAGWWGLGFVGLLLATDGDRRRAAAAEFRSFFMRSATPSVTVDIVAGAVLRANDAMATLLGLRPQDLVGRPVVDLVPDTDGLHARLAGLLRLEATEVTAELALPVAEDRERWVRCIAAHVDLGGPQADLVQVQFVDLTAERTRAASLERSNESLEQFGRRVTHDLKQPVAAVAAYASTLLEHGHRMDEDMVRTMHERLAAAARRAVRQLDDTFAAAAARNPGRVDVRLHELVADVVGVVDIGLAEAGGTVATNLMRGHVHTEPGVLRQVLLNLLTNSLKYAGTDTTPRIHVTSRVDGAGVELVVTDNGTGIPIDDLDAVFGRGVRLAPSQADGRGHGLADSRQLAESLGGTLRAEPWPDGARFVLWLPDPSAAGTQPPARVLLVAQDGDGLDDLRHRLEHRSAIEVVGAATSVGDAVVAARDGRPDVVVLDRALQQVAGLAGVVEIARAHRDARIVLLTDGQATVPDERAALSAGAVRSVDLGMDDDELVDGLLGHRA